MALRGRSERGVDELFVSREAVVESATTSTTVDLSETGVGKIVVVATVEGSLVLRERRESGPKELAVS